ncbi:MAG: TonB-dependent receptor [Phenylobacterium sp.]|uniref:TonB-dependent receptor n=1 Tax=Phenylobacterium sp. TaxID=1871053 RepID=UPI002725A340|nr:TonB-dependent receptor [Phenylobacterium sp.]MDO8901907.1 TonB-dependent receptor [Phenylobacterium sp.]
MSSNHLRHPARLAGARTRRALLAVSASLPILAAAAAPALADDAEVSELVVTATPIRDSIEASLEIQRASDNIVNVIASDTIGRFPDATAAGALARLPGVGVQRDQGQERYIQIRGAPTRWTTMALDGVNLIGAEDRIFRFDSVPAAQISQVVLNKTLLPNMPAEALAGRVNIETFSPLTLPGFHGSFDVGGGFVDMGDGPVKQYSGRLSWSNGTWGASLIGSHYSFEQHTDNDEPRFDDIGLSSLRFTKYVIERVTESYSAKLEYSPSDDHYISLSHLSTEFADYEERNWYVFSYANAFSGTRNFETADLVGVPMTASFAYGIYTNGVVFNVLHGDHRVGAWDLNWDLAYATTEFNNFYPSVGQTTSTATSRPSIANTVFLPSMNVTVNAVSGGFPYHTLYDTVLVNGQPTRGQQRTSINQMSLPESFATESTSRLETEAYTVKFDASRDWNSFGALATFSAGFQFDDRTQENDITNLVRPDGSVATGNRTGFPLETNAALLGLPWDMKTLFGTTPWDQDMDRGFTAVHIDTRRMRDGVLALMDAARVANAAGTGNFAVYDIDRKLSNTVDEKIASAYAMNRWKWDRHTLTGGVRVERTETASDGLANVGGTLVPLNFSSEVTHVFPSLHYGFDYSDNLKLRAAFITGAARPSMNWQRATVTVNDTSETLSGGNPFLVPERAYGVDLSAEWYFAPAALMAVSFFHREVEDVLFSASRIVGDASYNFNGVDRSGYTLSSFQNGRNGHLTGLEFVYTQPWTFLPGLLSGLGFQGSVSFTKGEFETPDGETVEFPGTSDRITSATLFYEKHGISSRLTWQHRTDWLDEVFPSGSSANSNLYWDESQRLDLSVRYQVNDTFSVFLDANNLTNEQGVRYQGREDRPYEVEGFGRKYLLGVRASF